MGYLDSTTLAGNFFFKNHLSEGARSDWGAKLVAQMFSFLETVRLQSGDAITQLCELLSLAGRSPPGLQST